MVQIFGKPERLEETRFGDRSCGMWEATVTGLALGIALMKMQSRIGTTAAY
jgi:hypothetical protein